MNNNSQVFGDKTVWYDGYIVCPNKFTTMNRKFVIMLLFVGSFGAGVGYCQSTTKAADAESSTTAQGTKKDIVPNDVKTDKKMDELSKKLLNRKKELEMDKAKPEAIIPQGRKDKPADKPKGDKK
jgi:hypothetical protein